MSSRKCNEVGIGSITNMWQVHQMYHSSELQLTFFWISLDLPLPPFLQLPHWRCSQTWLTAETDKFAVALRPVNEWWEIEGNLHLSTVNGIKIIDDGWMEGNIHWLSAAMLLFLTKHVHHPLLAARLRLQFQKKWTLTLQITEHQTGFKTQQRNSSFNHMPSLSLATNSFLRNSQD